MELIKRINIMENKKMILWLNVLSVLLFLLFLPIFTFIPVIQSRILWEIEFTNGVELLFFALTFFLVIIIHELIHGLFYKVFNPKGKVKFGFKNGMAYATSPHSFYSKQQFLIISIAPFVLISTCLSLILAFGLLSEFFLILLASVHAAGCVGDFYWSYLLCKAPKNTLIEDTEVGINFYKQPTDSQTNTIH